MGLGTAPKHAVARDISISKANAIICCRLAATKTKYVRQIPAVWVQVGLRFMLRLRLRVSKSHN